jgi:hypothetical protein
VDDASDRESADELMILDANMWGWQLSYGYC